MVSIGTSAPVALARWVIATSRVRGDSSASKDAKSNPPVASIGATTSRIPMRSRSNCHGTMFEWCSSSLIKTSSPALRKLAPQLCPTGLMPSVAPRVQVLAQCGLLDQLDRLPGESFDQHSARLVAWDAAGAQIKKRRLVEIADGGAVAAFHVVGVDFEFGLGVDRRTRAEHQVA